MDWRVSYSTKQKRVALLVRCARSHCMRRQTSKAAAQAGSREGLCRSFWAGQRGRGLLFWGDLGGRHASCAGSHALHHGPTMVQPCSKLDHCLYDLLIRVENGELNCTIPIIISNHPGARRRCPPLLSILAWLGRGGCEPPVVGCGGLLCPVVVLARRALLCRCSRCQMPACRGAASGMPVRWLLVGVGPLAAQPSASLLPQCRRVLTAASPTPPAAFSGADLEVAAKRFGVPFRHLPIKPKDAASKAAQEAQIEAILQEEGIDLIVLARYMQASGRGRRPRGASFAVVGAPLCCPQQGQGGRLHMPGDCVQSAAARRFQVRTAAGSPEV